MPTGSSPIREPIETSPREVRVNIGTAKEVRVNIGGSAREARVNFQGSREARVNFAGSREVRANFHAGKEVRADFLPYTAREVRANFGQGNEVRANFLPLTAREVRANFGDGYPYRPPFDGFPDRHGPPTYRGGSQVGSGTLSFSADFEIAWTWRKDGYRYTGGFGLGAFGISAAFDVSDTGQCTVKMGFPGSFYSGSAGIVGSPGLGYDTGPGVGNPIYGFFGSTENDTVRLNPDDREINDGDVMIISGSFSCWMNVDEYKQFDLVNYYDGLGEPFAAASKRAFAFNGMQGGYSLSVSTPWGQFTGPPAPNFPPIPSATFGIGERYLSSYTYNGQPAWRNPGDISGIVYDGLYPNHYVQPEASTGIGFGFEAETITDSRELPPHGARSVTAKFSNIMFHSGPWHPLPYQTTPASDTDTRSLKVGTGFVEATNLAFSIEAASETPAHVVGRVYNGDDLYNGPLQIAFGGGKPNTTEPGSGFDNSAGNIVFLDASGGTVDAYVPQIRSIYNMQRTSAGVQLWNPPLPADRNDYFANALYLVPIDSYDSQIRILDDYVWSPTTFTHAKSTSLMTFGSVTGWAATHGTVSGPNLTMTATADGYQATSPTPLGFDCRNFRYLHVFCASNVDGPPLVLDLSGSRDSLAFHSDDTVYTSQQSVKAGGNELIFDLCRPNAIGVSVTRTGWDTQPDTIFGVHVIDALLVRGIANGQTLTITEMRLERHEDKVPGYVIPEVTGGASANSEVYWYSPDVPFQGESCIVDGFFDPDEALYYLTNHNHTYARILRNYADGKPAADLPHAIGNYPWGFVDENGFHPFKRVKSSERLMLTDWVSMVNAQKGLSASAAQNGTPASLYNASLINAVFLTLDNFTVAAGAGNKKTVTFAPHLPTEDTNGPLMCRVSFNQLTNYPGQLTGLEYPFIKRLGHVYEGLVVNPNGGSAEGVNVHMALCTGTWPLCPPDVKTDKNGYFRFGLASKGLVYIATDAQGGALLGHQRASSWIGLGGGHSDVTSGCLTIDSARGWLHVGNNRSIKTFDLTTGNALFASEDNTSIGRWKALLYEERYAVLLMLGAKADAGGDATKTTFSVWRSQDGGQTASEIDSMAHNSSLIEKDSEGGLVYWLYEDANSSDTTLDHKVFVRTSTDGGSSFGAGVAAMFVQDTTSAPVPLQGVLLDTIQDARASGQIVMLCQMGSNMRILQSLTKGVDWTVKLTV